MYKKEKLGEPNEKKKIKIEKIWPRTVGRGSTYNSGGRVPGKKIAAEFNREEHKK